MKQSIKSCKKIGQDGLQRSLFPYCLCFSLDMIGHTLHCRCFLIRITAREVVGIELRKDKEQVFLLLVKMNATLTLSIGSKH